MSIKYSEEFLELLNSVKAKRPRTVIQHILEHGYITSQDLKDVYGYNHPPRAVRDVREQGIPLVTYREVFHGLPYHSKFLCVFLGIFI